MKKLDRKLANTPSSLNKSHNNWKRLSTNDKKKIWNEIDKFQIGLCAYCESTAQRGNGHIEHFFHKGANNFKQFALSWENLFGCCDSLDHCGHYKDKILPGGIKRSYDPKRIIKPDLMTPEKYFTFSDNGKIFPKGNLSPHLKKVAEDTIKALNLDCSSLENSRKHQIKDIKNKIIALKKLNLDAATNRSSLQRIFSQSQNKPHRQAVKSALFS